MSSIRESHQTPKFEEIARGGMGLSVVRLFLLMSCQGNFASKINISVKIQK